MCGVTFSSLPSSSSSSVLVVQLRMFHSVAARVCGAVQLKTVRDREQKLQGLCRVLQAERTALAAKVEELEGGGAEAERSGDGEAASAEPAADPGPSSDGGGEAAAPAADAAEEEGDEGADAAATA